MKETRCQVGTGLYRAVTVLPVFRTTFSGLAQDAVLVWAEHRDNHAGAFLSPSSTFSDKLVPAPTR